MVQESVAAKFYAKLKARMGKLRLGHSLDKNIDMGAVVDQRQKETIEKWIATGVAEGAELYQCGYELPGTGCFVPPTLLTNVLPASKCPSDV